MAWERAQKQQARAEATFEVDGSVPRLKAERARSRKRVLQEAGLCEELLPCGCVRESECESVAEVCLECPAEVLADWDPRARA
mgnify:FL=1